MHPTPAWVIDARRKALKRRARAQLGAGAAIPDDDESGSDIESSSEQDEEEVHDLFRRAGSARRAPRGLLQQGELDIDRVRDANQAAESASVRP